MVLLRREEAGFEVVVVEAGLDDAGAEVQAVRHDGGAQDTAGLVEGGSLHENARGEVAAEDFGGGGVLDEGELDAKANDDGQDEEHDKDLECAQSLHWAGGAVEDQDEHDLQDGNGAACDQRDLGNQEIDGNGSPNHLPSNVSHTHQLTQTGDVEPRRCR
jgi:hypothetical protein